MKCLEMLWALIVKSEKQDKVNLIILQTPKGQSKVSILEVSQRGQHTADTKGTKQTRQSSWLFKKMW